MNIDPSVTPFRKVFHTRDAEELMRILEVAHAPCIVIPRDPRTFEMHSDAIFSGGLCFSRTRMSSEVEIDFKEPFDGYGLSLPEAGFMSVQQPLQQVVETRRGSGVMIDSLSSAKVTMAHGADIPRISVTSKDLHGRLSQLIEQPVVRRINFSPDIALNGSIAIMALSLSNMVSQGLQGASPLLHYPLALASLQEAVMNLVLEGIPHNYSDQMRRRGPIPTPGSIKRAIEFMAAHAAEPLKLSDIAAASGISVRSLQTGFMKFRQTSPMTYLRQLRLNGARAELRAGHASATVSSVAHAWGFVHMSSFSSYYQRQFGESPSATIRQSKR